MKTRKFLRGLLSMLLGCVLMLGLMPAKATADDAALAAPTNIRFDGTTAKCDPVEGAEKYEFTISRLFSNWKELYKSNGSFDYLENPSMNLAGCLYDGEWKIEVTASAQGKTSSTAEAVYTIADGSERQPLSVYTDGDSIAWTFPNGRMNSFILEYAVFQNSPEGEKNSSNTNWIENVSTNKNSVGYKSGVEKLPYKPGVPLYLSFNGLGRFADTTYGPFYELAGTLNVTAKDGGAIKSNKWLTADFVPVSGNSYNYDLNNVTYQWQISTSENGEYSDITDGTGKDYKPFYGYAENHSWIRCAYTVNKDNYLGTVYSTPVELNEAEEDLTVQGDLNLVQNTDGTVTAILSNANFTDPVYSFSVYTYNSSENRQVFSKWITTTEGSEENTVNIAGNNPYGTAYDAYGQYIRCEVVSRSIPGNIHESIFIKNYGENVTPSVSDITKTTCTITNVEAGHEYCLVLKGEAANFTDSALLYKLSDSADPIEISNLNEDTEYTVYERPVETATVMASGNSHVDFKTLGTYTVNFNIGNGKSSWNVNVEEGETVVSPEMLPATEYININGKDFAGWYTDTDCTVAFDFATPITESKELFGKWVDHVHVYDVEVRTSAPDTHTESSSSAATEAAAPATELPPTVAVPGMTVPKAAVTAPVVKDLITEVEATVEATDDEEDAVVEEEVEEEKEEKETAVVETEEQEEEKAPDNEEASLTDNSTPTGVLEGKKGSFTALLIITLVVIAAGGIGAAVLVKKKAE